MHITNNTDSEIFIIDCQTILCMNMDTFEEKTIFSSGRARSMRVQQKKYFSHLKIFLETQLRVLIAAYN